MKRLFIVILLLLTASITIGSLQYISQKSEHTPTSDTLFLAQFYKEYLSTLNATDRKKFLMEKTDELDSTFYIQFKQPINGYIVKMAVTDTARIYLNNGYQGLADYYFIKDNSACNVTSPCKLPDTIHFSNREIIELDYTPPLIDYTKPVELFTLSHLTLFFFDADFDGEEEVLLNAPECSQRHADAYAIFKLPKKKGDTIQNFNYAFYEFVLEDGYLIGNAVDEYTQFDFQSKTVIQYESNGVIDGNRQLYYKIENNKATLTKIETYHDGDSIAKREFFMPNDTITLLYANAFMPIDLDMDLKGPLSEYYTCEPIDTTVKDKGLWSWKISRTGYKPLILKNHYRVDIRYLGDMNGDGDDTNEFGIRRETNNSEWDFFCIYTYQDEEWKYLIDPYMTYAPIFYNRWIYPSNLNDSTIRYYFNDIRYNGIVCMDTTVAIKPIPIPEFDLNKQKRHFLRQETK